ncbi:hypothetical protein ACJZ2D_005933 [Fusarium nematophilum]
MRDPKIPFDPSFKNMRNGLAADAGDLVLGAEAASSDLAVAHAACWWHMIWLLDAWDLRPLQRLMHEV